MTSYVVRGLFLAATFGVATQAAVSWWEPGLTVIRSSDLAHQPLAHSSPTEAQQARGQSDPQGLLVLFGLVQGVSS
ncbi:hypothetical protein D3C72_2483090 [compost metagenome]